MANIMTKRGSLDNIVTYEHYCDTKADLANIPENEITLGSTAIVLQDEDGALGVYIATSDKEWIAMMTTGGSGGSDAEENEKALIEGTIIGDYTIPDGTTVIGAHAFQNQYQMTSIVIPEGVEEICGGAFSSCIAIKEIITPESCTKINTSSNLDLLAEGTFNGMIALEKAQFPNVTSFNTSLNSSDTAGHSQFGGSGTNSESLFIDFPALLEAGNSLLSGSAVTKCYMPAVTKVGNSFQGCNRLTEVYIGPNCTSIGSAAFGGAKSGIIINCGFAEGNVSGAPWAAQNATINYNVPVPEVENE